MEHSERLWDLTERIIGWFEELLYRLAAEGSGVPGGWFTISILLILLVIAVVVAVRIARRTMRTNRGGRYALFGGHELSAAEHRATAEQYAAEGNWSAAIRHRLRAVARQLEEDGVLDPVPGRTATELARDAGRVIPDLATELRLTGGKTPHRRDPGVRRIRTFNRTAGQAVEHQGERRIAAFRAYPSRHTVNLLCGERRLLWFRRHDGRS